MRKNLLQVAALLLLFPSLSFASKTTLTGTINDAQGNGVYGTLVLSLPVPAQDITTNVAVSNMPVFFSLVNGAISGGAQLYDVANLQPSGLYYIARIYDSSGNLTFSGNYVITGGTFNLGAATPTTVTTSNISYLNPATQNGGNVFSGVNSFTNSNTFSGSTSFTGSVTFSGPTSYTSNTITLSNSGVFTNTQMNEYLQSLLNSCSPQTEFQATQTNSNFSTGAIAGCVTVPNGATVHQENGIAGYSSNASTSGSASFAVGGYFSGRQIGSNGASFGSNSIVTDTNTEAGAQLISAEEDMNVMGAPARAWGIMINGASSGTMPALGSSAGIEIRSPSAAVNPNNKQWPASLNIPDASGTLAINVGATGTGNNVPSMPIQLNSRDGGGVSHNAQISFTAASHLLLGADVQKLNVTDKGQCTMAAGACTAQNLSATYANAPTCFLTWTGSGTLAGTLKVASTTTTVTPSSSTGTDTAVVNWICFGS